MKKNITLLALFAFNHFFTQVGINTTVPTQTFDVNGTTRFRAIPGLTNPPASFPGGTDPLVLIIITFQMFLSVELMEWWEAEVIFSFKMIFVHGLLTRLPE